MKIKYYYKEIENSYLKFTNSIETDEAFVQDISYPEIKDMSPYINEMCIFVDEYIDYVYSGSNTPLLKVTREYELVDEPYKLVSLKLMEVEKVRVQFVPKPGEGTKQAISIQGGTRQ